MIRGGVDPQVAKTERTGASRSRSYPATIVKRSDDGRARLRLEQRFEVRQNERLLLETDFETIAVDCYAVHPEHSLIDVRLVGDLDHSAKRVMLRRSPFA